MGSDCSTDSIHHIRIHTSGSSRRNTAGGSGHGHNRDNQDGHTQGVPVHNLGRQAVVPNHAAGSSRRQNDYQAPDLLRRRARLFAGLTPNRPGPCSAVIASWSARHHFHARPLRGNDSYSKCFAAVARYANRRLLVFATEAAKRKTATCRFLPGLPGQNAAQACAMRNWWPAAKDGLPELTWLAETHAAPWPIAKAAPSVEPTIVHTARVPKKISARMTAENTICSCLTERWYGVRSCEGHWLAKSSFWVSTTSTCSGLSDHACPLLRRRAARTYGLHRLWIHRAEPERHRLQRRRLREP